MKYRNFLDVARTPMQNYFKDGVELLYANQRRPLRLAILPAYDTGSPDPTGWVPAVTGDEESDFYTVIRAAKFVGHGNRTAKTSFLSPKTFDRDADDPYESFYDYCCGSDRWSYLTKDRRGKRLTGEPEGAVFPAVKTFFCANVVDASDPRGGVFVTELSEAVMRNVLYWERKDGRRVDGFAFQRDASGALAYGDITNPAGALVLEVAWSGKGYVARTVTDDGGRLARLAIPSTLLQHRQHMEEPGAFLERPKSGQEIVDRIAGLLRGYKRPDTGEDEIEALKEAMEFAYGSKYKVDENASEEPPRRDPFAEAAERTVVAAPEAKAGAVAASVERGVERERYTPVNQESQRKKTEKKEEPEKKSEKEPEYVRSEGDGYVPGEGIDFADIASIRSMLAGK